MSIRVYNQLLTLAFILAVGGPGFGYIHFPPMTFPKMCSVSPHIRLLQVEKFDKDKGVIHFKLVEALKGKDSLIADYRQVVRTGEGIKPIRDWAAEGKQAVLFTIEGRNPKAILAVGYVFIDDYCYSVDYNTPGKYWLVMRGEPGMSVCYHGGVKQLVVAVRDSLAGKEVKVPTKETSEKMTSKARHEAINKVMVENRDLQPKLKKTTFGKMPNASTFGDIMFGGQPTEEDLQEAKKKGIKAVLNLREADEMDFDEAALVKKLGMKYIHIPWQGEKKLTDDVFDKMRAALKDSDAKPMLFHCLSANRVGAGWLAYRVLDQNIAFEEALKEARAIGLSNEAFVTKAKSYIERKRK